MSWKPVALVAAGLLAGLLISQAPGLIAPAEAGSGNCWLEATSSAQKFEDGVNAKVAQGYKNVVGYQYEIYVVNGQPTEMYTALQCK